MSRRRPDHTADMESRTDARRLRRRRRRRRAVRGTIKVVFWGLVLAGVFVLGLGYGRTLSSEQDEATGEVTITVPREAVTATLPTKTVTVTKTVRATRGTRPAVPAADGGGDQPAGAGN